MTIVIFTSQTHLYANSILSRLIQRNIFSSHRVIVFEEDALVPGKSKWQGLRKYLAISGVRYVSSQVLKQILFMFRQWRDTLAHKTTSDFYPFERLVPQWDIRVVHSIRSDQFHRNIAALKPDLIVSLYSKEIISDRILGTAKYGAINLHPGLLPAYRGVSPVFWALTNGEKKVGITLHILDTGIDTGDELSRKQISTRGYRTEHALYLRLSSLGEEMLESFLQNLFSLKKAIHGKKFDRKKGTYYSLPTKAAVRNFLRHGYRFFQVSDFFF